MPNFKYVAYSKEGKEVKGKPLTRTKQYTNLKKRDRWS